MYFLHYNDNEVEKYTSLFEANEARQLAKECCYKNVYVVDDSLVGTDEDHVFPELVEDGNESNHYTQDLESCKIMNELAPIFKKYKLEV